MKACVCMLEVSRHGLLETELLALLAEERNIKMPAYDPNAENVALEKTKNTTDDGIDKDVKENIKETQQNISKLVQETYVKEDKEGKDKKNVKCMDSHTCLRYKNDDSEFFLTISCKWDGSKCFKPNSGPHLFTIFAKILVLVVGVGSEYFLLWVFVFLVNS